MYSYVHMYRHILTYVHIHTYTVSHVHTYFCNFNHRSVCRIEFSVLCASKHTLLFVHFAFCFFSVPIVYLACENTTAFNDRHFRS